LSWLQKHYGQGLKTAYLAILILGALILSLYLPASWQQKLCLAGLLILLIAIHADLRDGGLLSRLIFRYGGSYQLRNYLTSLASFVFTTALLLIIGSWHLPLIMLYLIPIVLTSIRSGYKVSLAFTSFLLVGLITIYGRGGYLNKDAYMFFALFIALTVASGTIADRLRRAAVDLSALYESGKAISSKLDEGEIVSMVANIIFFDIRPQLLTIFLYDASKGKLKLSFWRGLPGQFHNLEFDLGQGITGRSALRRKVINLSERRFQSRLGFETLVNSAVAVPMLAGDQLVGVIFAGRRSRSGFDFENIRFLEALSSQAAIAIQNARSYGQVKREASTDALTGLFNRAAFIERLDLEWRRATRYESPLSLIIIDVDLFKSVNDSYGHLRGDAVLAELGGLLRKAVRETDFVARYGGEEFSIILPHTHHKDAYFVADKLRRVVAESEFGGGEEEPIKLTISLGLASYPGSSSSKSELLYQADQALYQAKAKRNSLFSSMGADYSPTESPLES
jgi:diguanylate cyclase (GGDEF)-like protein